MAAKKPIIGIRREDKNAWERRAPLTPEAVKRLLAHDVEIRVQTSKKRVFSDAEYRQAGAQIVPDMKGCTAVFGVKEIPVERIRAGVTYVFFSHTVKGQPANMPLLRKVLDLQCRLIDYERVVDARGRRLIFFGKYAGIAGMIDSLWALGLRFKAEGHSTPFEKLKPAHDYASLEDALAAVSAAGDRIYREGLPGAFSPLLTVFTGRGNVSRGAQLVYDRLPVETLEYENLIEGDIPRSRYKIYKVEMAMRDLFEAVESGREFSYKEYHDHPERFRSTFPRFLEQVSVLVNGIFWEPRYPKLLTRELLRDVWAEAPGRLRVIGDISCDVGGSIEANVKATDSSDPVYVYEPATGKTVPGVKGDGPVVMAVDNLPCELPRESSTEFSDHLEPFVLEIARGDDLSDPVRKAVVAFDGRLAPEYSYLAKSLQSA